MHGVFCEGREIVNRRVGVGGTGCEPSASPVPTMPVQSAKLHSFARDRLQADSDEFMLAKQRKADRLPHETGLKLLFISRASKELRAMAFIRNSHDIAHCFFLPLAERLAWGCRIHA